MIKKLIVTLTTIALVATLTGCGTAKAPNSTTQQTTQQTTSADQAQATQAHGNDTPLQAGTKVDQASVESKVNDLLTKKFPGDWKLSGTTLSKGSYTENDKSQIVGEVASLFSGNMGVSIFVGEDRISSSLGDVKNMQGYLTPSTVGEVFKSGKTTTTQSGSYAKVYIPLKSGNKTLAVLLITIPADSAAK